MLGFCCLRLLPLRKKKTNQRVNKINERKEFFIDTLAEIKKVQTL